MTAQSKPIKGLSALALLLALLAVMGAFAIWPHLRANSLQAKMDALAHRYYQLETLAARGTDENQREKLLSSPTGNLKLLLSGSKTGIAGANLQKLILDYVSRNGGHVSRVLVLPPVTDRDLVEVSISLNITGNTKGLRDIVFDIETSEPLLFIEELVVRPERIGGDGGQYDGALTLNASMKIVGYLRKGSKL